MLPMPGQWLDWYPEKTEPERDFLSRTMARVSCQASARRLRYRSFAATAKTINRESARLSALTGDQQKAFWGETRASLRSAGLSRSNLIRAFASIKRGVFNIHGFELHDEQLFCAWALMHGLLAEMATGEGKSITAGAASIVAAAAGAPVHVITTNDYLVQRDAEGVAPLLEYFDFSVNFVLPEHNDDERRAAYASDVCYVSNKQLVFDYLRDRQALGNRPATIQARLRPLSNSSAAAPLLRGLCFAIVDEADSVLIDDAITPLVLSQQVQGDSDVARVTAAISLARRLELGEDFTIDRRVRTVSLCEAGEELLTELVRGLDGIWKNRRFRHEYVRQALSALHLFSRDIDYLVRDGEVILIDQSTGRVMPDRKLQHGLHQMIEIKEQCELSGQAETLASLSFQHFFQRYQHLCGMTGTASEAVPELRSVYQLPVIAVPTHSPSRRTELAPRFAEDERAHADLIVHSARERYALGQPVLVGTRSLAQSEQISAALDAAGLTHTVLNARQDENEAEVVAQAGTRGSITIATNIAGRGTDIPVADAICEIGGLHVIVAQLNDNRRIDRQLVGRCARQGDPGTYQYLISLDDELLQRYTASRLGRLRQVKKMTPTDSWHRMCMRMARLAQRRHESAQFKMRKQVAATDAQLRKRLSFTGYKE
ncbi:MAG: hypothetical protein AB8B93_19865 [Pseudomonadales bacterium]